MRHSGCVIAQVINGKGPKLAEIMELSESRVYEILSTDNPYPKAKRLIRAIARVEGCDISLIKADMMALFDDLMAADSPTSLDKMSRETFEALQCEIESRPKSERRKEWLDVIAVASHRIKELDGFSGNGHVDESIRKLGKNIVEKSGRRR